MIEFFTGIALALALALPLQAADQPFSEWRQALKAQAVQEGINAELFADAFQGVQPNPRVISLDRKQPESTLTLTQYLDRVISDKRVREGRDMLQKHAALLERVSQHYGVQPRFIVSLWGIETSYGKVTGGFPIVEALATLAYDGRRSDFFRKELMHALHILQGGHITLNDFKGSWAGAMGQTQFMPSSFISYAEDFNGDGRKDIWNSLPDIFASIANYLANTGWNDEETWGRRVELPQGFDLALVDGKNRKSLADWQASGVRRAGGADLPQRTDIEGALLFPGEASEGAYLIYGNFDRIMRWNRSHYFATAVGILSDRIAK